MLFLQTRPFIKGAFLTRFMHRTPLYGWHEANGATFVDFAGFEMPVHYGRIKEEHQYVREHVGLFDVSHMSNLRVEGPAAAATIDRVVGRSVAQLEVGRGAYCVLLHEDGTILDDAFAFRMAEAEYFLVPNAGMNHQVADHLRAHGDAEVTDETEQWAIIAVQGPKGRQLLESVCSMPLPKFHRIVENRIAGHPVLVAGTGYTGEKGGEVFVRSDHAVAVWKALICSEHEPRPIGLGARDTLRLEKAYALAGNEFEGGRTPFEAGLDFTVDLEHPSIAQAALRRHEPQVRLQGLQLAKGIARHGYPIHRVGEADPCGIVTSGTQSPTLGTSIALGYIPVELEVGDEVDVEIRGNRMRAKVHKTPFL